MVSPATLTARRLAAMALIALGFRGLPFHDPFHEPGRRPRWSPQYLGQAVRIEPHQPTVAYHANVAKLGPGDCWPRLGAIAPTGHGRFRAGRGREAVGQLSGSVPGRARARRCASAGPVQGRMRPSLLSARRSTSWYADGASMRRTV